jgi:hypothetical protein
MEREMDSEQANTDRTGGRNRGNRQGRRSMAFRTL